MSDRRLLLVIGMVGVVEVVVVVVAVGVEGVGIVIAVVVVEVVSWAGMMVVVAVVSAVVVLPMTCTDDYADHSLMLIDTSHDVYRSSLLVLRCLPQTVVVVVVAAVDCIVDRIDYVYSMMMKVMLVAVAELAVFVAVHLY